MCPAIRTRFLLKVSVGYLGLKMDDSHTTRYVDVSRYYDPVGGRYLSESGGGHLSGATNLYVFANNSRREICRQKQYRQASR
jgi:hypothetical protein